MHEKPIFLKKTIEKVKDSAKILALLAAFTLPGMETSAQGSGDKEKEPFKIENNIDKNKETIKIIRAILIDANKGSKEMLGDYEIISGSMASYDVVMSKEVDGLTILMTSDHKFIIIDKNSDGLADEVIMNDSDKKEDGSLVKIMTLLSSKSEELIDQSSFLKGTPMEMNYKVVRFNKEIEETTFLDLKEGKGLTADWSEAEKIYKDSQEKYTSILEKVRNN